MAGESGSGGSGALGGIAVSAGTHEGTTVGGSLSEIFLGVDLHRKSKQRKESKQQKALYRHQVAAERAILAARLASAPPRPAPGRPLGAIQPPKQSTTASTPQTTADVLYRDLAYALELYRYVQDWLAQRRAGRSASGTAFDWSAILDAISSTPGGVAPQGGADVAYVLSTGYVPGYGISNVQQAGGGVWGAVGSALGQLASGAINAIAMPGGAPIPTSGGWIGQTPGIMPTVPTTPTRAITGRSPQIIVANGRAYRSLGTPLAWSGDLTAVKRLRRAAARIGRVVPRRGGGKRFR